MKEITKDEYLKLLEYKVIMNTRNGLVNEKGTNVGFYRTRNKRYIEDKYANRAKSLR